jgi:transcriptional regulator with XRE-family HTH domain
MHTLLTSEYHAILLCMARRKSISEIRRDISASTSLHDRSQEALAQSLQLNQATLSRILRGRFRRYSPAVAKVCSYASISRMTDRPADTLEAAINQLAALAKGGSAEKRHALKLIRLAAELLEAAPLRPARRVRQAS